MAWSLAGVFANHIETRSYVYIATSLAGVASLAAINAVGILFRPVSVLVSAWGQSTLPHLSAALANGRLDEFDRTLGRALIATAAASLALGAALWLAWRPVEHYLLGGKYGRKLHFWDLHKRKHLQEIDFGEEYQLVFDGKANQRRPIDPRPADIDRRLEPRDQPFVRIHQRRQNGDHAARVRQQPGHEAARRL